MADWSPPDPLDDARVRRAMRHAYRVLDPQRFAVYRRTTIEFLRYIATHLRSDMHVFALPASLEPHRGGRKMQSLIALLASRDFLQAIARGVDEPVRMHLRALYTTWMRSFCDVFRMKENRDAITQLFCYELFT